MKTTVELVSFALFGLGLLASSCTPQADGFNLSITVAGGSFGEVLTGSTPESCTADCSLSVKANSAVVLQPLPSATGAFLGWSGACSGTGDCTLTVSKDSSVVATFGPRPSSLHVEAQGPGHGAIRTQDGQSCTDACDLSVPIGERVHLQAQANADSYFAGWSGACSGIEPSCEFDAADGLRVTAQFAKKMKLVVAGVAMDTKGQVTSSPTGIRCPENCTAFFFPGEKVTLSAAATDKLWRFNGWPGADCSTATCEVTMDSDKIVNASFSSMNLWVRAFKVDHGLVVSRSASGDLTVGVQSSHAQDFGLGDIAAKSVTTDNLFLARLSPGGVPSFTKVFGGTASFSAPIAIREMSDNGFSIVVGIGNPGDMDISVDLEAAQVPLLGHENGAAWMEFDASGKVVAAGPLDATYRDVSTAAQSGTTIFVINKLGNSISALGADWSRLWTLSDPKLSMDLYAGPSGTAWVTTRDLPVGVNCTGAPAPDGALLRLDATGACSVVWAFPPGLSMFSAQAPGGDMVMDIKYPHAFEFAGTMLPEPSGLALAARLRFDSEGNPLWWSSVVDGGSLGQHVYDAIRLDDGDLLLTGNYQGFSDFSPDVPEPDVMPYLATYSEDSGAMDWFASFPATPGTNSSAQFAGLVPMSGGRVALWGTLSGTFDFGGGPVKSTAGGTSHFIAAYQF